MGLATVDCSLLAFTLACNSIHMDFDQSCLMQNSFSALCMCIFQSPAPARLSHVAMQSAPDHFAAGLDSSEQQPRKTLSLRRGRYVLTGLKFPLSLFVYMSLPDTVPHIAHSKLIAPASSCQNSCPNCLLCCSILTTIRATAHQLQP